MSQEDRCRKGSRPNEVDPSPLVAVVDDDTSVRQSICRLIRSFGYRVEAFGSGDELLQSGLVAGMACLFLDVRMPGMDGLEVQRRLRESGARVPIVFLTAMASEDEEQRARGAGAAAFLRKPIAQETLLQALESMLWPERSLRGDGDDE